MTKCASSCSHITEARTQSQEETVRRLLLQLSVHCEDPYRPTVSPMTTAMITGPGSVSLP